MSVELSRITEPGDLVALREPWRELTGGESGGGLFYGPDWLLPWWHTYHHVLGARLHVLVGRAEGKLVCLAPFYERLGRKTPGVKVREIRLLGDAGPRPAALDIMAAPGHEDRAGREIAKYLAACDSEWDLLDIEPLRDPSRTRAAMITWLGNSGHQVKSQPAAGAIRRIALTVAGIDVEKETAHDPLVTAYVTDAHGLRKGLSVLKRLSRLEWANREEQSPFADREAVQLLETITLALGEQGKARLARLDDSSGEAIAVALVVDDDGRAVVLAMAVDPDHFERQAPARLLLAECRAAAARGLAAVDVVTGAHEYDLPPLPLSQQRAVRVQVYSNSGAAKLALLSGAVRRRVEAARDAQGTAAAGARAAWAKIRTAAAHVAHYERMHLYRGELWTRGIEPPEGLVLGLFSEADFDALGDAERAEMIEILDLDDGYCREKWQRGDLVVLARLAGHPAGISWCARDVVRVPQLDRILRLDRHEAYIHDVYVAARARGRSVAPAMLEFLSNELRQRDVYRAWALIGDHNIASVRAFEKAAYTAVADVIYAHIAGVDRLLVRPPDSEAKQLLGIS